jgi:hypothetical protein
MALIEVNTNPSRRDLRWFGLVAGLFLAVVGVIAWWKFDAPRVARAFWIAAPMLATLYYVLRPLQRSIYVGWMVASFPIGWLLSHLILAVVYYGVLTPIGLVMRLTGRAAVTRRFDPDAKSYWIARSNRDLPIERYFRQF